MGLFDLEKVTQKPISKLSSTIQAIIGLKDLSITFGKVKLKEKAFSPFYFVLSKLSQLEKLHLSFQKCPKVGE